MYELKVEGMSCGHCVSTVTKSVQAVDAAAKVDVDLATQKVRVNSSAKLDDIKSAIVEAGYPVLESSAA
ncbi:MAG TPA: cation transporter [Noviherbaspirillum sp.]|uniref:heavy-metal-associated domain-containing protein n=1 Tax=Noviherbaspirillum sp. TaxID=1926288 RepID=UPI002B488E4F|nr:cation transporter [Noviherbaspirillum sp.]HJV86736.1 cation transporter [Noviherbaspirillum sp.]